MSSKVTGTIVACLVDLLKNGLPGATTGGGSSSARPSKKQKR